VRYAIYGLILFFFGVIFFNMQPDSNQDMQIAAPEAQVVTQTSYLFYDAWGNEYDIFGNQGIHGAPQSWEYLFEGIDLSLYSGQDTLIGDELS
jgi:hypothetical protein